MDLTAKISALLTQKFEEDESFQDCYVIEIELKGKNRLNVFLDADTGIDLGKCHRISRHLEAYLDEHIWEGEKYWLEISSPGLSRPLKVPRQYLKNIDRKIEVRQIDKAPFTGILKGATDTTFDIEVSRIEKEGKKKKEVIEILTFPFDSVEKVIVKATMTKLKKPKKERRKKKKDTK